MEEFVKITIDGKHINALKGSNLLQLAKDNGIPIPSLCYHKKLSPTGACRLCLVKIKGTNGLVASCTVQVKEEMEVTAFDDELEECRKYLLDYLVSEHNEENDNSYTDEFFELLKKYNLYDKSKRKYPSVWKLMNYSKDDSSPVLTYDASKCIKCFRCIKACDEVQGKNVLSFNDRGMGSYIIAGFDKWKESECDGCGECIQLCPTGAIVEKPHRSEININNLDRKVKTTCPYCGVGCQIEMQVKDEKILRSNGVEGVSPNDGRLCIKGRFGYDFVQSKERLTHPLIKKNGKFEKASWDEALDLIASKFNECIDKYGNEALAGYSSAKCTNEENYIFQKFIRTVFGNNNVDYCTRLCHASTVTAMLRSIGDGAGSNSIEDFETTDCLLVTGNNIIETHPITATYVKRGVSKGMQVIIIDPKWTPLVNYASIWLQPRLGTDVALLNGMIRYIIQNDLMDKKFIESRIDNGMQAFEYLKKLCQKYTPAYVEQITGVPGKLMTEAARIYATSPTSMIATGMGMSQQVTGTNNVFSLINMMLITAQIGKERAGIDPPRGQNNVQGATDVGASPLNYPGYIPVTNDENRRKVAEIWNVPYESLSSKPGLTTVEIAHAAYNGKIKALYIMGENPMLTDPNLNHAKESFNKLDFLVVQDIFHTETTAFADVILPAASFAEKNGTFVNSDRRVLRVRKVVDSPGEARNDWKIILDIAQRMGKPMKTYNNESEIFDEIAAVTPIMAGINHERIEEHGIQWPCYDKNHPGTSTLFLEKFNTPNGKAKLNPVDYVAQQEKVSDEYPFLLNSGRILYQYHSSTMSRKNDALNAFANKSYVLMHPNDVIKHNFIDGIEVKLTSARGNLTTTLRISEEVLEGELFMPWHFSESPVNNLTRDELDPHSKIAPFKLSACKVEKV
ncbi:MAG: formate dehydrogenase subunit alpha [Bacteroidetes bacterium]|nr:formate dehydrogenase subunit alpha [Bacteroidota bacterium]